MRTENMHSATSHTNTIEAKIVVLGPASAGKTTLVDRYVHPPTDPSSARAPYKTLPTVSASFHTTRAHDLESDTSIRLQLWDTAGQERFRSISRLYYRGANAAILCYDVTSAKSFEEVGGWLKELRGALGGAQQGDAGADVVVHVVGCKTDLVIQEPSRREVPFERCVEWVGRMGLADGGCGIDDGLGMISASGPRGGILGGGFPWGSPGSARTEAGSAWDGAWSCCHEISARDGEGVEEVFRVVTRRLIEQHAKRMAEQQRLFESLQAQGKTPGGESMALGYFDFPGAGNGSFRVGHGDKRRSFLGIPVTPGGLTIGGTSVDDDDDKASTAARGGRCYC